MASPQVENGHVKIANDLYEALCQVDIPAHELRIVHAIIRNTYGWKRTSAEITADEFSRLTGIRERSRISELTSSLAARNIIVKTRNPGGATTYSINKDYDTWKLSTPVRVTLQRTTPQRTTPDRSTPQRDKRSTPQRSTDVTPERNTPTVSTKQHESKHESKYALCRLFFGLNGRHPGDGHVVEGRLREREDFVEHLALTAMDFCHKERKRTNDSFVAHSLKFYEPAIIDALTAGKLPGQRNGGNGKKELDGPEAWNEAVLERARQRRAREAAERAEKQAREEAVNG